MADDKEKSDARSGDKKPFFSGSPDNSTASYGDSAQGLGGKIGPYKLLSILGEGGYGIVYLAEQQKPIRRQVALKIIKPGMDTKQVIARFEAERQALALLEHPNIASVHDAGTTKSGLPYFVMEFVKGVPITEHCDRQKSSIEERLRLFSDICDAIQYAHQKGIIHRDIKPSNILVSFDRERAVPKVIDFGIAKAISQPLTERTLYTEQGQFIGTPEYMSPEQAEMTTQNIDTRSDVYSLGVVLYELLTGVLPFDPKTLREAGIDRLRQIIREQEPKTPSTRLSHLGEKAIQIATKRHTEVGTLTKRLHKELEWIPLKAMRKERTHRYRSVSELADDIQNYLNGNPLIAGPESATYQFRKFVHRHRALVIATAVVAVLLAGCVISTAMYIRAAKERIRAESFEHKQILSKAQELFASRQYETALTEIKGILGSRHVAPAAHLLHARLHLALEEPAEAIAELESLLNESASIAGRAHFFLAAIFYDSIPTIPEQRQEYQQTWEYHRQKAEELLAGTANYNLLRAQSAMAVETKHDLLNKALELDRGHFDSLREQAYLYHLAGEYEKMSRNAARMMGIRPDDPLGYSLSAVALRKMERYDEALKDHDAAIRLAPDNPVHYEWRRQTYMDMGRYEEALRDARRLVELLPENTSHHIHVFLALVALGRYEEANEYFIITGLEEDTWDFPGDSLRYVFDTLDAGLPWHPPEKKPPEDKAFLHMHEATELFHRLAGKARRVKTNAFHPVWSPDGTKLACDVGPHDSGGLAVVELETGKTKLLAFPGGDAMWSPDGKYIAFSRSQPIIPVAVLTKDQRWRGLRSIEDSWLIKSDGTGQPRRLSELSKYLSWSRDSETIYGIAAAQGGVIIHSISIGGPDREPKPIAFCYPADRALVSPDSKHVAYAEGRWIQVAELSSGHTIARWHVPPGTIGVNMSWSPDGRTLCAGTWHGSHFLFSLLSGLWTFELDTGRAYKILSGPFNFASLSSDGRLAFAVFCSYYHEIWVASLESLEPKQTVEEHCQYLIRSLTRRIEVDPDYVENYWLRAEAHIYLRNTEKVFEDLDKYAKLLKKPQEVAQVYNELARDIVTDTGWIAEPAIVLQLADRYREIDPAGSAYLPMLGAAYYRLGKFQEAITTLSKATNPIGDEKNWNYLFLAMAYWQVNKKDEARRWYGRGFELIEKSYVQDPRLYSLNAEARVLLGLPELPERANTPMPPDGSHVSVDEKVYLSWIAGSDAAKQNLYFGTGSEDMRFIGNVYGVRIVKMPDLEKGRQYFWRVDTESSNGSIIKGKLWSFSSDG